MKYRAFGRNWKEFGFNDCLTQSLHLLDVAATIAAETGDTNTLIDLSREWLDVYGKVEKVTSDLEEDDDEGEEEEEEKPKKQPLGFASATSNKFIGEKAEGEDG